MVELRPLVEPFAIGQIPQFRLIAQAKKGFLRARLAGGARHGQHPPPGVMLWAERVSRDTRERAIPRAVAAQTREWDKNLARVRDDRPRSRGRNAPRPFEKARQFAGRCRA